MTRSYEIVKVRGGWIAKRTFPASPNPRLRGWGSRPDLAVRNCDEQIRREEKSR
jgi:hypothetical protein